jgi:hypothetical protein
MFVKTALILIYLLPQIETGWIRGSLPDDKSSEFVLLDSGGNEIRRVNTVGSRDFVLAGIPPGAYELRPGSQNVIHVEVRAGCESVIDGLTQKPFELWSCDADQFDRDRLEAFPTARNIWNVLQTEHISSVPDRIDEGGFQTGTVRLMGIHGGTWTQNGYRWDGLNITNPYEPGKPLTYPMFEMLEEFKVAPGAEFQMMSRRGGRAFHGRAQMYYLGDALQSSNLDDRLRSFGFQTTPHFKQFPEAEFSAGGRVPRTQQWSYFASFGFQHVSRVIPDFGAVPSTTVTSGFLRADGAAGAKDDLSAVISGQSVKNSHLGAEPGVDPSATLLGNDRFELLQGHWVHRYNERSVAELVFGFSHSSPTDTLQHGVSAPSSTRLFTGEVTGSAPLETDSALSRFSLFGQMQSFRSRHQLSAGLDLEESLATEEKRMFNGLQLFLFPGDTPSEVAEFNTPSHAMQRLRELSFFAQDGVHVGQRIFIRAGVYVDSSRDFLPRQVSGAGVFAPVRAFGGISSVVSWLSASPRVKVVVPVGKTRIIAGYSRIYHLLPASYADFANPNGLGGALYRWNDKNGDRAFQPGEEGTLLRVFGGPYSSVDPNLKRPFTDEWGVALEQEFGRGLQAGVRLLDRESRRFVHTINVGVPFSSYIPVTVVDSGNGRVLTVFNQDPRTLGQDRYLLTNPGGVDATYKGVEANVTGRFSETAYVSVSFSAYKSIGSGNPGNSVFENDPGVVGTLFDDPNTTINSRGRLFFDRGYTAKIAAHEEIPYGIRLSSIVAYFDGLPFGRKLSIPDLNQGPIFVMATPRGEPGGFRTQFNMNFDQRVSREFQLGSKRISLILDTFNLLNLNRSLREVDITGPSFDQRKPVDVENPRVFRVGAVLTF